MTTTQDDIPTQLLAIPQATTVTKTGHEVLAPESADFEVSPHRIVGGQKNVARHVQPMRPP